MELAPNYECEDEVDVSDSNENELVEYEVPEVVQARWRSNNFTEITLKDPITYTHKDLIDKSGNSNLIGSTESNSLTLLYSVVGFADNKTKTFDENNKPMADCRVMHAGRYYNASTGNNYVNYVAASRCLYNCAYLIANENATKARLREYVNKYYDSGSQSSNAIEDARKDLRIIINAAYDHDLFNMSSNLTMKKVRTLQFLGFAIHAATDAFAHQYVVNTTDATPIVNNTRIERLQGSLTVNGNPVKTNISYKSVAATKSSIQSGTCNTKDLVEGATDLDKTECHRYYADNLSYVYARYDTGSKDCVSQILSLFGGGSTVKKFDPRVFINNSYQGESYGNARIPIWDMYENVKYAGYTPELWQKGANTESGMRTVWQKLSSWR